MANRLRGQRNTRRRQPYAWLGAGALGVGLALAGAGTAHADDGVTDTASTAAASSARASGNSAAGAAATSTPRSPAATSRSAGPRQSVNDGAGKRALTAANRSTLAATPRVRSAVPVSAASTSAGKPSASERTAQVVVPTPPVQNLPTASAAAAVPSEAGDRPLRRPVERAVAAPAPAAARAVVNPAEALNAAVVDWFDSTSAWLATLPRGPLNEWASGALLLVRRSLFNQLPTADPYRYLTTLNGDLVGTLGVRDPEADALTYRLTTTPLYGTVQIAPNGTYTYTPGLDYVADDVFTVAVADSGFNLFNPLRSRTVEVTVQVPRPAPVGAVSSEFPHQTFDLLNLTGYPIKLTSIQSTPALLGYPPQGADVFKPGETAHFEFEGLLDYTSDTRATFTACVQGDCQAGTGPSWTVTFHTDPVIYLFGTPWFVNGRMKTDSGSSYTIQDVATVGSDRKTFTVPGQYALLEPPATTRTLTSSDAGARELLSWFLANTDSRKPPIAISMNNVQFNENPPGDPGYTRQISADNTGDAPGSINRSVNSSTSTTRGSNWEVSGKASWSPIEKILGLEVAGKYGKSESETNAKSYSTTVTSTSLPWSANEILTAPPKLLVTGDAQVVLGTGADARTYSFTGVQYYFPNPNLDAPLYLIRTEPLQQKYTAADNVAPNLMGTPIPNVGFTLRDKSSPILSPTYSVGQVAQLTVSAYQGVGASADKTGDPRTIYTTSNPAVATVDTTGALTAMGPGTATITAIYKWAIPYGNGTVRNDYVLATINVKVT